MNQAQSLKSLRKGPRRGLSKSRLMSYRQCPKRLWLDTYRPDLLNEEEAQAAFAFGHAVGEAARRLHPGGHLIEGADLAEALAETQRCGASRPRRPLFEATFDFQSTLVRADLLLPVRTGYRLVEVKASTEIKPHYYDDVAIQAWVMGNAGVPLRELELAHVNNAFVYRGGGKYDGLLRYEDVAPEVRQRLREVPDWVKDARKTLTGSEPDVAVGPHCKKPYDCPFMGYCWPEQTGYPLTDLPHGGKLVAKLEAEGYADLRKVPARLLTKPPHRTIHQAIRTGRPVIKSHGGVQLRRLGWPRRYLDFETIQFAVPIWKGTRPYQQIPFQWSCHVETRSGRIEQREFLAEAGGDPRRGFVESLVEVLGKSGPIFVYNAGFERGRMNELADALPKFAAVLRAAIERIVDLLPIMRKCYYHPEQHGSWSLKAVLPTLAPDLDYAELEVSEGGKAAETFRSLLDPEIEAAEAERLRAALREYCGRDTLALVRIARFLQNGRS